MLIKLLWKRWKLRFVPTLAKDKRGDIDPPETVGKTIRVLSGLKGQEKLEIIIHESLHAAFWFLDEEYVHTFAEDIAKVLWDLGLRWKDENDE